MLECAAKSSSTEEETCGSKVRGEGKLWRRTCVWWRPSDASNHPAHVHTWADLGAAKGEGGGPCTCQGKNKEVVELQWRSRERRRPGKARVEALLFSIHTHRPKDERPSLCMGH